MVFQNFRGRRRVFLGFFDGFLLAKPEKTFINLFVFNCFSIKNHIKLVFWSKVRPRPAKGGHNVRRPWAGRRTFGAPRLFRVLEYPAIRVRGLALGRVLFVFCSVCVFFGVGATQTKSREKIGNP